MASGHSGSNGMRAVQPSSSIIEQAKRRRRKPAQLYNFNALFDGKRHRQPPEYCRRADGQFLFYHGKENAIYGETEAGKDMLLAETVMQALEWGAAVSWIDFEESNEIDIGNRLREMGADRETVCDFDLFRFSTPEDVEAAQDSVYDAIDHRCQIVVFNGMQSAYGLFGWDLYDPTSPAKWRRALVSPLLKRGRTVIGTDHMTKSSAEGGKHNGSRYAAGGIAKLNWIDGAAYLLEAYSPIIRGGSGASKLILTKDRPGSVKPSCVRIEGEPRMMFAGMLTVKSTGDEVNGFSLNVDVSAPAPGSIVRERKKDTEADKSVPDDVIDRVIGLYEKIGKQGASKAAIEGMYQGDGARHVRAAIEILKAYGCIVSAGPSKTSNIAPMRYAKEWDPKQRVNGKK